MSLPQRIPRVMSTQHPDNVTLPFFTSNSVMGGEDEVKEAFYVYSHMGIDEQLWDVEGKEVDQYVVHKLLSQYPEYFHEHVLGKDKYLTVRVPNPDVEKSDAKVLLEVLYSLPRNADIASAFYGRAVSPMFEVVVPMCQSERPLMLIHEYYHKHIVGLEQTKLLAGSAPVSSWLGPFRPKEIRVTPLFETKEAILNADRALERYMRFAEVKDLQRVWFARSDPALNYGSVAAALMVKIGLQRLYRLEKRMGILILPVIGCGSAPFRGNLRPDTVQELIEGYPSVQTFIVQSAFKYDFPLEEVRKAIGHLNATQRGEALEIDEPAAKRIIDGIHEEYIDSIRAIAPLVNEASRHIPGRRKRKLHVGLFGYSREAGGIQLPRAIKFTAALYSLGLPPELLGLSHLSQAKLSAVRASYRNVDKDLASALSYYNEDNLSLVPEKVAKRIRKAARLFAATPDAEHAKFTKEAAKALRSGSNGQFQEFVLKAAHRRRFLG